MSKREHCSELQEALLYVTASLMNLRMASWWEEQDERGVKQPRHSAVIQYERLLGEILQAYKEMDCDREFFDSQV